MSALENLRHRIGADVMFLLELDGRFKSFGGIQPDPSIRPDMAFPFADFLEELNDTGEASGIIHFQDSLYSIIGVPLLTPVPSAWTILGFEIDSKFLEDLQQESSTQISVAYLKDNYRTIQVSTLPQERLLQVQSAINGGDWTTGATFEMRVRKLAFISYVSDLTSWGADPAYAILQRDLNEAMAPYYRLRVTLILLSLVALLFSVFGGATIASSVSRPVRVLAGFARDIERGEYSREIQVDQKDELGQLAQAFNAMSKGLYERDRVRNLLGKVISPEIAEELIKSDVKLGGEEKDISILFTDLRGFTGLSENRAPADVLDFLNEYLTRMTAVIDRHGGVVDKYIGDAIMALFGAPLELENHAERAVACAIEMVEELENNNRVFREKGWPELAMGIGVHTGKVVVGNMGSRDRLNYTAIGDGVNLASRLESVTKEYGLSIIVSEETMKQAPSFRYKRLDTIQVKGKQEAVTIFTPGLKEQVL